MARTRLVTSGAAPTARLVHGMGTELVEAPWPELTAEEGAAVLREYFQSSVNVKIEWTSPRPMSAAALISAGGRRLFLKRHSSQVRTVADLAEEHGFSAHLSSAIEVPLVLRTLDGATAVSLNGWTYEVQTVPNGMDLYRDELSWTPYFGAGHAYAAGAMLARLHDAARTYQAPVRQTAFLVTRFEALADADPLPALERFVSDHPLLAEALSGRDWQRESGPQLLSWHRTLYQYLPNLEPLWTHNDWHGSNLLWQDDGEVAAVLDFGLCNRTTAIFDLATAIERSTVDWLRLGAEATLRTHLDQAAALINGYLSVTALTSSERAALPLLLAIVHVEFALSELEYFHGVTGNDADAELAYHQFLLGHLNWFATSAGEELLRTVRTAAAA